MTRVASFSQHADFDELRHGSDHTPRAAAPVTGGEGVDDHAVARDDEDRDPNFGRSPTSRRWRITLANALHLVPGCLLTLLAHGCRPERPMVTPSGAIETPLNLDSQLAKKLLGAPADLALFLDVSGLRLDAIYGPMLGHELPSSNREFRWLTTRVDHLDLWAVGLERPDYDVSGLLVLRSGRLNEADLGPTGLGLGVGRRLELGSGAVMFVLDTTELRSVVFLVDGSLVLATGDARVPAYLHFLKSRTLPPALGWNSNTLASLHARPFFLPAFDGDSLPTGIATSVVWHGGQSGEIVASGAFDSANATKALTWLRDVSDMLLDECPSLAPIRVERTDQILTIHVITPHKVLAAWLNRQCFSDE